MIIGVISAKGGVGKTTLVANLANVIYNDFGKKVLIIDGNITTPTLGVHMGILSQENTLDSVLNDKMDFHQAVYIHSSGIHVLPSSLSPKISYPDTEKLKDKLDSIKNNYDFIFIDGAAGVGKEVIDIIKTSDTIIVVSSPETTSILSAVKAVKTAKMLNTPVMGIVLNNYTNERHKISNSDIESICETKVISTIPFDKKIFESIKKMMPIVLYDKKSVSITSYKSLACQIVGEDLPKEKFWDKIRSLFG